MSCAWLIAALGGCAAIPGQAAQREGDETKGKSAALGALSYRIHCQSCHGVAATGDGPMAELLKTAPADLTRLAADNRGVFPAERVFRAIDGREAIVGHGAREMPVWGISFQDRGRDSDQEASVREKIRDLVAYLESPQVAAAGSEGDEAGPHGDHPPGSAQQDSRRS